MVLGAATAAAAAAAGGSLFEYNRDNFLYDRKLRQETEYNIMDFRIKQANLWREDVSDMIGLTSVKMDTYLIVNIVELGFCVMAFCEGRIAAGTPIWLIGCHTLSLAGAFMYLLMSVWLAMHASVTAKSYEVRLLTHLVRLPVPSWTQLEGARTYASTFEKMKAKQMFRVPFALGTQEGVLGTEGSVVGANPDAHAQNAVHRSRMLSFTSDVLGGGEGEKQQTADVWGLERRGDQIYELDSKKRAELKDMRHVRLVRHVMQYWQSYDGFARAAMSVGTNQLVTTMSYYVIAYVLISHHAVVAAWLVVMVFMVIACALIRLDMSLSAWEYKVSVCLVITGPCVNAVAAWKWSEHTPTGMAVVNMLIPLAYLAHALWLTFLLHSSNVRVQRGGALLPTGFRSVMFIDVFGWLKEHSKKLRRLRPWDSACAMSTIQQRQSSTRGTPLGEEPCAGPAVFAVGHGWGEPVAMRPEDLPGATLPPLQLDQIKAADLEPTTFVPREKDEEDSPSSMQEPSMAPGFVPWRIFCAATTLLIVLWWLSGGLMLLLACGIQPLKVDPLRRPDHHGPHGHLLLGMREPEILVGGQQIATRWPHTLEWPMSIACSSKAGGSVVATSRFDLFTAQLSGDDTERNLTFLEAPPCAQIEGHPLLDVTLMCGRFGGPCIALVLHQDAGGESVSACKISSATAERLGTEGGSFPFLTASRMNVADSRPDDAVRGSAQEQATSIAVAEQCQDGSGSCAFVGTSSSRIIQVRMGTSSGGRGEPYWFPTHLLQSIRTTGDVGLASSQRLRVSSIDSLHLGVLRPDQHWLDVLNSKSGELVGRWQLPTKKRWVSACSAEASLYVLSADHDPQVWRFPLPPVLQRTRQSNGVISDKSEQAEHRPGLQKQRARQKAFLIPD